MFSKLGAKVKPTSAKSRGETEMGNDWNYQFGGQMQIHWESFTFIWVYDCGDRWMVDGGTRDKFERNWHLEYKMVAWLHGTTWRNVVLIWPTFDQNFNLEMGKSFHFS